MNKIVNIAYYGNRSVVTTRLQLQKAPVTGSPEGRRGKTPPKGILLQFPRAPQGPLFAAALASAAVILSLAPAIHI